MFFDKKITNIFFIIGMMLNNSNTIFTHTYIIDNKTEGTVRVSLSYSALGREPKVIYIDPSMKEEVSSGAFCLKNIIVQGVSEPISGLHNQKKISVLKQCTNHTFTIIHIGWGEKPKIPSMLTPKIQREPILKSFSIKYKTDESYYKLPYEKEGGALIIDMK